jgi:divalent metal cation (Fe/Co/Zn/Cd) transporter
MIAAACTGWGWPDAITAIGVTFCICFTICLFLYLAMRD